MITADEVKTRFPEFDEVPDETIDLIIAEVYASWVDDSWGTREDTGAMYMVGHLLAVGGFLAATGDDSAPTTTRGGLVSERLGDATLTYGSLAGSAGDMSGFMGWLNGTAYGRMYGVLLMAIKRGPRVV